MSDHDIEESVKVYLEWSFEKNGWVIDPATVDGQPLDGLMDGATCDITHISNKDFAECLAHLNEIDKVGLPTGEELLPLLADALGWEAHPKGER